MDAGRIGVFAESFRLGLYGGLRAAREIGAGAVQISTAAPDVCPEALGPEKRRELKRAVAENGLVIASICGDLGGHGLAVAGDNAWKLPKYMQQISLCAQLGAPTVTTHIGVIPACGAGERYQTLLQAMYALGVRAREEGVRLAIETGPETPEVLRGFIEELPESVGVNLDPANLVMVTGSDPVKAVYTLRGRIYHTHVKDGVMLKYAGPEAIYGYFADGGIGDMRLEEYFQETPLGRGDVDIDGWLAALDDIGYNGYYTIEREAGADPRADIAAAVEYLKGR